MIENKGKVTENFLVLAKQSNVLVACLSVKMNVCCSQRDQMPEQIVSIIWKQHMMNSFYLQLVSRGSDSLPTNKLS